MLLNQSRGRHIVNQPSVIFYPRPMKHRLITDEHEEIEVVCATT